MNPSIAIVRGVNLEDERGLFAERRRIVLEVRAVGGSDLDQPRAGARHDVGHAEGAADLDQFAARDDRFATLRERVEHEQNRGRVVVDDRRILRPAELAQQAADQDVALAAPAGVEIELERNRLSHRSDRGLDRRVGERRAPEIGVQHDAGQVEYRPHPRLRLAIETRQGGGRDMVGVDLRSRAQPERSRARRCGRRRAPRAPH